MLLHVEPGFSHGQELEHRRDLRQGSGRFIFFCRSFRSLNLGGKGSRVLRACNAARAWPVRCLCAVRLTVRAVRAAGAQAAACAGWLLASGAAAGAPALLARVTAGPSNTAAPTAISRCRLARSGFKADMVLVSPAFPRPFPASQVPVTPPSPPSPLVFFSVFFQTQKHVFF